MPAQAVSLCCWGSEVPLPRCSGVRCIYRFIHAVYIVCRSMIVLYAMQTSVNSGNSENFSCARHCQNGMM